MAETKQVKIRCPECGTIQKAEVVQHDGAPWSDYVHECTECGYVITESEWEKVADG